MKVESPRNSPGYGDLDADPSLRPGDCPRRPVKARGISIVKEQFAVQKAKLFGIMDTDYQVTEEGGAAIGIRTANDKCLALQLAIGYRVFVCDNMAFQVT